jgi:protein O-GlcNAc transferase
MTDYKRMERYEDALADAQTVVGLAPNAAESHANVAYYHNRLGEYGDALKSAHEAISLNPDYPDAHFVAGCAMQGLEDHQAAISEALVNLGNAYLESGRAEDALAPLKRAVELRPECLEAHDFLGAAYFQIGDARKAETERALMKTLDPSFEGALSKLLGAERHENR